jgi:hypothetical protein
VATTDRGRERLQLEQHIRHHLRVVADRLTTADRERTAAIAAAHRRGLSVRQIAAAVRLSSARVHQLLHAPALETSLLVAAVREAGPAAAMPNSDAPLPAAAALLRECTDWLERLDLGEAVSVNLREASEVATEYVAVDKTQVRDVLLRLARDLEDLARGSETLKMGPATSRQERLADLVPAPRRLSPYEERLQLRRQLGFEP